MKTRTLAFSAFTLVIALVFWGVLCELVQVSRADATGSHLILMPVVSLALAYQDRNRIFFSLRYDWLVGGAAIVVGGITVFAAQTAIASRDALSVSVAGVVLCWVGGFVAIFGRAACRASAYPFLFAVLTIPIPSVVVALMTQVLKAGSATATAALFSLSGTPYFREGFVFTLPTLVIEIADECSGIRSSIALWLTGLLAGRTFLNAPWARSVLLLVVLPVTVVKNAVRIVALSLMAVHVDRGFITGQLHHEGGVVFFVLGLVLLAAAICYLRKLETSRPAAQTSMASLR